MMRGDYYSLAVVLFHAVVPTRECGLHAVHIGLRGRDRIVAHVQRHRGRHDEEVFSQLIDRVSLPSSCVLLLQSIGVCWMKRGYQGRAKYREKF